MIGHLSHTVPRHRSESPVQLVSWPSRFPSLQARLEVAVSDWPSPAAISIGIFASRKFLGVVLGVPQMVAMSNTCLGCEQTIDLDYDE